MSNSTYIIIGVLIVVALIAVALSRKSKSKKPAPVSEPVAPPPAETPQITPGIVTSPFTPGPSTSLPEPNNGAMVEVWNQTRFPVVVTQQELQTTLSAQDRVHMDSRFPLTATPENPGDAPHGVSVESGDTPERLIIRANKSPE
ncbi:hypothetical protein [Pseudomonas tolaasii]|uniref:hypothetical protein n=1 Tax=Pseudomonas tolaasii TaxID=29442 RepID=UPI0002E9608B|nr:hypothetical protein [Pseudomonas tolaasii]MBW1248622.1 hypothetical protein [Pseudomonas tolaasii]MBW4791943.1 hypothetical protein [Pseudomonas tolaasii]